MIDHHIYTIGKMKGLSVEDQLDWRYDIEHYVRDMCAIQGIPNKNVTFIHPPDYYSYAEDNHKSEAELMEWELNQIAHCDIVIVNLDGIEESIGSHIELGVVNAVNMVTDRHIFVLGLGKMKDDIYPWIKESIFRCENDAESMAKYIVKYLIL